MRASLFRLSCFAALTASVCTNAEAASATITVTKAEIAAGKLRVEGRRTGTAPTISLDGAFSTGVVGGGYTFTLDYLPADCIADLAAVGGTGGKAKAVIANCGPKGLNAKGAWSIATNYVADDVVSDKGSSFRALRANLNKPPQTNPLDWQVLASKGQRGQQGIQGATGPQGLQGPIGLQGDTGPQGPKGDDGLQGLQGTQGPKGDTGPTGRTGPVGPVGPRGAVGPAGPVGPQGNIGPTGPQGPAGTFTPPTPTHANLLSGDEFTHFVGNGWVLEASGPKTLLLRSTTNANLKFSFLAPTSCTSFADVGSATMSNPHRFSNVSGRTLSASFCANTAGSIIDVIVHQNSPFEIVQFRCLSDSNTSHTCVRTY